MTRFNAFLIVPPTPAHTRRREFPAHSSTMSYIHQLLNALLRGLVIYAVLGLERTYSNDLHNQPSDAAHVATTGKHQSVSGTSLQFIYACTP